eukprot:TRINITY_DN2754_c0_g1_i1.p2 TRINITY_DN2754_c0_g1~~TRINITY_DN2754_c0_g1_i1.p2  ORF type:complete len:182 (+),score=46.73 TRINITY_DN2754_c0_g1_i1:186-731(+)
MENYRSSYSELETAYEPIVLRSKKFEQDLEFYYGKGWEKVPPSKIARDYAQWIVDISNKEPLILIAIIYHLYMALLAGGQIIRGWAKRSMRLPEHDGTNIFEFDTGDIPLRQFFRRYRARVNEIQVRENLIDEMAKEGTKIFEKNNQIIQSLDGYRPVIIRFSFYILLFIAFIFFVYKIFK